MMRHAHIFVQISYGISMILIDSQWFSMILNDSQWFSMHHPFGSKFGCGPRGPQTNTKGQLHVAHCHADLASICQTLATCFGNMLGNHFLCSLFSVSHVFWSAEVEAQLPQKWDLRHPKQDTSEFTHCLRCRAEWPSILLAKIQPLPFKHGEQPSFWDRNCEGRASRIKSQQAHATCLIFCLSLDVISAKRLPLIISLQ
jgi:hypothetical protein